MTVPDSIQVATLAPPLLLWAVTVYKLPTLTHGRPQAAFSAYWSAIACLAVAMTLLVPPVAAGLNALSGVPNLSWLLHLSTVLLSGFSAAIALLHELGPESAARRGTRVRRLTCAILTTVITSLFAVSQPSQPTEDFVMHYGGDPAMAAMLTVFFAGLTFICLDMGPKCWRAGATVTGLLRLALRGTALAAALTLIYIAYFETIVVQLVTGHSDAVVGNPLVISRLALIAIVALIAVGTSLPDWGPRLRLDELAAWLADYRARRKLFRLWYDLRNCVPAAEVPAPGGRLRPLPPQRWSRWLGERRAAALRDVLTIHDAAFQLHRRVIDVTDSRVALADYQDLGRASDLLAGIRLARRDQATEEAAGLAASINAKRKHHPAKHRAAQPSAHTAGLDDWSLDAEVKQLTQLARAYRKFDGARSVSRPWADAAAAVRPSR